MIIVTWELQLVCHLGESTLECVEQVSYLYPQISLELSHEDSHPTYKGVHS